MQHCISTLAIQMFWTCINLCHESLDVNALDRHYIPNVFPISTDLMISWLCRLSRKRGNEFSHLKEHLGFYIAISMIDQITCRPYYWLYTTLGRIFDQARDLVDHWSCDEVVLSVIAIRPSAMDWVSEMSGHAELWCSEFKSNTTKIGYPTTSSTHTLSWF